MTYLPVRGKPDWYQRSSREIPGLALPATACDVLVVGGYVLTAAGQQASAAGSLVNSHAFWYGILLACLIVWILPGWAGGILFVVAVIASDVVRSAHGHFTSSELLMILFLLVGLVIGLWIGRRRGLRLLAEAEFRTRWRNVLGVSRWW